MCLWGIWGKFKKFCWYVTQKYGINLICMFPTDDSRLPINSSDEDGSDFEARQAEKLDKAKALKEPDEESESGKCASNSGSGSGGEEEEGDAEQGGNQSADSGDE
jgi:hypothetical protein